MSPDSNGYSNDNLTSDLTESVSDAQAQNASAKFKQKARVQKVKKGFYYSFLTLVLLFCLVQVGFGAILNITKTISYKSKINTLEKVRDEAEARNKDLKADIQQFSKATSLESIARNNLKMAGEDEVLVIINKEVKDPEQADKKDN